MTANISPAEIQAIADDVDAEIDGLLGAVFYWPYDAEGNDLRTGDIPPQIIAAANYITAGILEQEQFAQSEAGGPMPNPYGKALERTGRNMLQRILDFQLVVEGLVGIEPAATRQREQSFFPVSGLPLASGPGFRRRGLRTRGGVC